MLAITHKVNYNTKVKETKEITYKQFSENEFVKNIKDSEYVITLDLKGKQLSSEELSKKIESIGLDGKNDITYIIGGSLGLSPKVINTIFFITGS
jgi:23S rRNA (pseudouridine1915-N3)-methyltransferase